MATVVPINGWSADGFCLVEVSGQGRAGGRHWWHGSALRWLRWGESIVRKQGLLVFHGGKPSTTTRANPSEWQIQLPVDNCQKTVQLTITKCTVLITIGTNCIWIVLLKTHNIDE
jgi:hypothetical protein